MKKILVILALLIIVTSAFTATKPIPPKPNSRYNPDSLMLGKSLLTFPTDTFEIPSLNYGNVRLYTTAVPVICDTCNVSFLDYNIRYLTNDTTKLYRKIKVKMSSNAVSYDRLLLILDNNGNSVPFIVYKSDIDTTRLTDTLTRGYVWPKGKPIVDLTTTVPATCFNVYKIRIIQGENTRWIKSGDVSLFPDKRWKQRYVPSPVYVPFIIER